MSDELRKSGRRTIVSSPGKVLLAGGYLVLDRAYSGVVVATSSRFYSSVTSLSSSSPSDSSSTSFSTSSSSARISVRAGQFPEDSSVWTYVLEAKEEELQLTQSNEEQGGKNKFIAITLLKTLQVVYESIVAEVQSTSESRNQAAVQELFKRLEGGLEVVVLADNDFYSQREQLATLALPTRISSLASLEPFTPLPRPIPQTNKTGLGSSAALVTSLVASLLAHLGVVSLSATAQDGKPQDHGLGLVHSLAQLAHCLAQGKVGSGFDVSSAVYGTHLYTRFSPSTISSLMDNSVTSIPISPPHSLSSSTSGIGSTSTTILSALDPQRWDSQTRPFRLPRGLRLILADVDAGTDTPSFVGKVLSWRKENPEQAKELWDGLDQANMQLERLLTELTKREDDGDYDEVLQWAKDRQIQGHKESQTAILLFEIRVTLFIIRDFLRKMSDFSGVPIEPPKQTKLIDASSELPGVLGGGVPGAGGYDALFLLVIDDRSVIDRVDDLWNTWTEMSVCPLSCKQSDGGLRVEDIDNVTGLREALRR